MSKRIISLVLVLIVALGCMTAAFAETPKPVEDGGLSKFKDVDRHAYYASAVSWAIRNGVTNGTSPNTFSPNQTCTRAQIVTFLYRSDPDNSKLDFISPNWLCPFQDVDRNAYYMDAVQWAVRAGITKGTSNTAFAPDATCTRAQIVTFMYRYAHYKHWNIDVDGESNIGSIVGYEPQDGHQKLNKNVRGFSDVGRDYFAYNAVRWAVAAGITKGTSETTFSPEQGCTRAQAVTFLYRMVTWSES